MLPRGSCRRSLVHSALQLEKLLHRICASRRARPRWALGAAGSGGPRDLLIAPQACCWHRRSHEFRLEAARISCLMEACVAWSCKIASCPCSLERCSGSHKSCWAHYWFHAAWQHSPPRALAFSSSTFCFRRASCRKLGSVRVKGQHRRHDAVTRRSAEQCSCRPVEPPCRMQLPLNALRAGRSGPLLPLLHTLCRPSALHAWSTVSTSRASDPGRPAQLAGLRAGRGLPSTRRRPPKHGHERAAVLARCIRRACGAAQRPRARTPGAAAARYRGSRA